MNSKIIFLGHPDANQDGNEVQFEIDSYLIKKPEENISIHSLDFFLKFLKI